MNGPLVFEVEPLTREHVDLSRYSKRLLKVVTVVGGGDNVAALGGPLQGYFCLVREHWWRCHFGTLGRRYLAWCRDH
jgi:hypothetical protein